MCGVNVSGENIQKQKKIVRLAAAVAVAAMLGLGSSGSGG